MVTLPYPPPRVACGPNNGEAEGSLRGGGSTSSRAPHQDGVALTVRCPDCLAEAGTERIPPRHPDVVGGGRDRDGRGPLTRRHLLEDGPLVSVGSAGIVEPAGQEKLHRDSSSSPSSLEQAGLGRVYQRRQHTTQRGGMYEAYKMLGGKRVTSSPEIYKTGPGTEDRPEHCCPST